MDKDTHDNINRLDRRGYKSRTAKHHKPFTITNKPQESKVPYREGSDNIIHTSYNTIHTYTRRNQIIIIKVYGY